MRIIIYVITLCFISAIALKSANYLEFSSLKNNYSWIVDSQSYTSTKVENNTSYYEVSYFRKFNRLYIGLGLAKNTGVDKIYLSSIDESENNSSNFTIAYNENLRPSLKFKYLVYSYDKLHFMGGIDFGILQNQLHITGSSTLTKTIQEETITSIEYPEGHLISNINNTPNDEFFKELCPANEDGYANDIYIYDPSSKEIFFFEGFACKSYSYEDKDTLVSIPHKEHTISSTNFFINFNISALYEINKFLSFGVRAELINTPSLKIYRNYEENIKLQTTISTMNAKIGGVVSLRLNR